MKSETGSVFEKQPEDIVEKLLGQGRVENNLTFKLSDERGAEGEIIEGHAYWLRLKDGDKVAEGKLFTPTENDHNSLIIFEPGMPGDAVGWMEKKHVPALIKKGYTILVLRHLGTKIDTDKAPLYIQCPERQEKGKELQENALGGNSEYDVESLSHEVTTALNILGRDFSEIKMVGHSAGALFNLNALMELSPEIREKITNYVSLSGFVGGIDARAPAFSSVQDYYRYCGNYLNLGDPAKNEQQLRIIFERVYANRNTVPKNTMVTVVHSPNDEYLTIEGSEKLQEFLERGLHISDRTEFESEFHDLKNLQPQTLVRLLGMYYPKSKHSVEFNKK